MGDLETTLVIIPDDTYLHDATDIRAVVKGRPAQGASTPAEWHPAVVGIAPDSGAQVTIAGYEQEYEKKADASKRARDLLRYVKRLRAGAEGR